MPAPRTHHRRLAAAWAALLLACALVVAGSRPARAQTWAADPPTEQAEVLLLDFEDRDSLVPGRHTCDAEVNAWPAEEDPREGVRCAGIAWSVRAGRGSIALECDVPLPGRPEALHLWVRGDASGALLTACLAGAAGETRDAPLGRLDFAGWRRLSLSFEGEDAPRRLTGFRVEGIAAGEAGVFYLDDMRVATRLAPAEQVLLSLSTAHPVTTLDPARPVEVLVRGRNLLAHRVTADLRWELADYRGAPVLSGEAGLRLPPGDTDEQIVELAVKAPGFYRLRMRLQRPGITGEAESAIPLAILPARKKVPARPGPAAAAEASGVPGDGPAPAAGMPAGDQGIAPETPDEIERQADAVDAGARAWVEASARPASGALPGAPMDDRVPRPEAVASRVVADQLQGLRFYADVSVPGIRAYRFEGEDAALIAAWSVRGETTIAARLRERTLTVVGLMGESRALPVRDGVALVPMGGAPCFLRLPLRTRVSLTPLLTAPSAPVEATAGQAVRVGLMLRRAAPGVGAGSLRVDGPPGWRVHVERQGERARADEERIDLVITPPADAPGGEHCVAVALDADPGTLYPLRVEVPVNLRPPGGTR